MAASKTETKPAEDLQAIQDRAEQAGKAACRQSNGASRGGGKLADAKADRSS